MPPKGDKGKGKDIGLPKDSRNPKLTKLREKGLSRILIDAETNRKALEAEMDYKVKELGRYDKPSDFNKNYFEERKQALNEAFGYEVKKDRRNPEKEIVSYDLNKLEDRNSKEKKQFDYIKANYDVEVPLGPFARAMERKEWREPSVTETQTRVQSADTEQVVDIKNRDDIEAITSTDFVQAMRRLKDSNVIKELTELKDLVATRSAGNVDNSNVKNSDNFVQKWRKLANGNNNRTKLIMVKMIYNAQNRINKRESKIWKEQSS